MSSVKVGGNQDDSFWKIDFCQKEAVGVLGTKAIAPAVAKTPRGPPQGIFLFSSPTVSLRKDDTKYSMLGRVACYYPMFLFPSGH